MISGIILAGYIILMPWYVIDFMPLQFDSARFMQISVLVLISIMVFEHDMRVCVLSQFNELTSGIKFLLVAMLLLALFSAVFSELFQKSILEISLYLLLVFMGFICTNLVRENPMLADKVLVVAFVVAGLLFVCLFSVQYAATYITESKFSWYSPFVSYSNVRLFSQYQSYTVFILVLPLLGFNVPLRWRMVGLVVLSCWWALIFATGSRSIWFAIVLTVMFLIILLKMDIKSLVYHQLMGLLLGGAMYFIFDSLSKDTGWHGVASMVDRGVSANGRWELWTVSLNLIKENPWLGVGPMQFAYLDIAHLLKEHSAHPHNTVLQLSVEYGLPFTVILLYMVFIFFKNAVHFCKESVGSSKQINIALTASLACGFTESLVSGNLIMPHSQMCFFILSGWLMGRNRVNKPLACAFKPISHLILVTFILSCVLIQAFEVNHYYQYMLRNDFAVPSYAYPRFWHDGHYLYGL
jgi:O-antigen ligase